MFVFKNTLYEDFWLNVCVCVGVGVFVRIFVCIETCLATGLLKMWYSLEFLWL